MVAKTFNPRNKKEEEKKESKDLIQSIKATNNININPFLTLGQQPAHDKFSSPG